MIVTIVLEAHASSRPASFVAQSGTLLQPGVVGKAYIFSRLKRLLTGRSEAVEAAEESFGGYWHRADATVLARRTGTKEFRCVFPVYFLPIADWFCKFGAETPNLFI